MIDERQLLYVLSKRKVEKPSSEFEAGKQEELAMITELVRLMGQGRVEVEIEEDYDHTESGLISDD